MMNERAKIRGQIRGFVVIWTVVTFLIGLATFLAIYFTYSPQDDISGAEDNVSIPLPESQEVVVLPSITPQPTPVPPTPAPTVEEEAQEAVAEAQQEPTAEPTTAPPTAVPTSLPVEDEQFQMGIQVQYSLDFNPDNQDGYYRSVADDLTLEWVKVQVRWEDVEREEDQYDWGKLDLTMPSAERFGLRNMLSIVTAPEWAREPGISLDRHGPPADNQDYVDFVIKLMERYPGQVHAIEVWNEQNIDREWTSMQGLSATNYVSLLRDTYNAVKAIDPGTIIISGALSPTGFDNGINAIDDFRYMGMLISAGMLEVTDCVGVHHNGYNVGPSVQFNAVPNDPTATFRGPFDNPHHSWTLRSTMEGYWERIQAAGFDTPLCVTEFGWAVTEDLDGSPAGFEFANDNTLQEQATWFVEAMQNFEDWGFIWLAFVWNFNYAPQAGWDPSNDNVPYSLIGPGFSFRPAYDEIREWYRDYRERTGRT